MRLKLISLFFVLLLSSFALAGLAPTPVSGQVVYPFEDNLEGLNLAFYNEATGETNVVNLDSSGYFVFDFSNVPFQSGNTIDAYVQVCKEKPQCHTKFKLVDGQPMEISLVVPSSFEVVKEQTTIYVCADGSQVLSLELCPVTNNTELIKEVVKEVVNIVEKNSSTVEVLKTQYICSDGSVQIYAEDCPASGWELAFKITAGLVGVAVVGLLGLYAYNRRKYKWAPGFAKKLKGGLAKAQRLKKEGKDELAKKELNRVKKSAETIIKRHIDNPNK